MNIIQSTRNFIAKTDTENYEGALTHAGSKANKLTGRRNFIDTVLQSANLLTAGTPASWVTGGVTILTGLLKLGTGIAVKLGSDNPAANRIIASGMKSVLSGATAPIPGVGHAVNSALLAMDTVQFVNNAAGPDFS